MWYDYIVEIKQMGVRAVHLTLDRSAAFPLGGTRMTSVLVAVLVHLKEYSLKRATARALNFAAPF